MNKHRNLKKMGRSFRWLAQMSQMALAIVCVSCILSGSLKADEKDASFGVMSFNIRYDNPRDGVNRWSNRKSDVAKLVQSSKADIIGMQEVVASQFDYLKDQLKEFEVYGVGRDDGKRKGEFSPIFYRKDRFELLDKGTFWLSKTPKKVGSKDWDAAITRICTWVKLKDLKTKKTFFAANTHFDHRGSVAREMSGKLISEMIGKLAEDLPIVLSGDFNCMVGSKPFNAIVQSKEHGFQNSRSISKAKPTGPNSTWCGFTKIAPGKMIDFVFVSKSVSVTAHKVVDDKIEENRYPSDHLPVLATVKIND